MELERLDQIPDHLYFMFFIFFVFLGINSLPLKRIISNYLLIECIYSTRFVRKVILLDLFLKRQVESCNLACLKNITLKVPSGDINSAFSKNFRCDVFYVFPEKYLALNCLLLGLKIIYLHSSRFCINSVNMDCARFCEIVKVISCLQMFDGNVTFIRL